jgi:AhpD family alkylhydroperoxidase
MSHKQAHSHSLSPRERELTALGAAIASNCIPCIEYHVPQSLKAGLNYAEIREAVELADRARRVPADKVRQTALALLARQSEGRQDEGHRSCGCM